MSSLVFFLVGIFVVVLGIVVFVGPGHKTDATDATDASSEADVDAPRRSAPRMIAGVVLCVLGVASVILSLCVSARLESTGDAAMILDGTASYDGAAQQNDGWTSPVAESVKGSTDGLAYAPESDAYSSSVDESAVAAVESGFVKASDAPVSTISADVDTASWSTVKESVLNGSAVRPDMVRIEEMLNYFSYGYAAPASDNDFAITKSVAPCPWNKDSYLLALGYASSAVSDEAWEKPLNITFLVDVSGSMGSSDKLELFKSVLPSFVERLSEKDSVSLVTYSGEERVVLDSVRGSEYDCIVSAVNELSASGSTNGEAGINKAYDLAFKNFDPDGVNRVVMVTDGDLNVGVSSPKELESLISSKAHEGVYFSAIGVGYAGPAYSDKNLESLADNGDGAYFCMRDEASGVKILCDDMVSNIIPFADDVKSQVSFNAAEVDSYRLIGYANRTLSEEDFRNDSVDAAEVGPNSQFTVLYEIVPTESVGVADMSKVPEGVSFSDSQLADLGFRWKSVDGGEVREVHDALMSSDATATPSDDWRLAAAVAEFGQLVSKSKFAGTSSVESIEELVGVPLRRMPDAPLGSRDEFVDVVSAWSGARE